MADNAKQNIAGERLEDLAAIVRKASVLASMGRRASIHTDFDDVSLAAFSRAAERHAADLLVPDSDLSWRERFERGAPRVADEVARAVRNHDH